MSSCPRPPRTIINARTREYPSFQLLNMKAPLNIESSCRAVSHVPSFQAATTMPIHPVFNKHAKEPVEKMPCHHYQRTKPSVPGMEGKGEGESAAMQQTHKGAKEPRKVFNTLTVTGIKKGHLLWEPLAHCAGKRARIKITKIKRKPLARRCRGCVWCVGGRWCVQWGGVCGVG